MNHSACEASPASFSRWGIVSFYDDTGLGRQAKDLFQVLGMERFLAVPSEKFTDISLPNWITPLREETSRQELESLLEGLDGILFPERSYWHPKLLETAKQKNLKTVCIPIRSGNGAICFCVLRPLPNES
jgi:hypothetical protein